MAVENLKPNKIKNVELLCGDVKSMVQNKNLIGYMPLPKTLRILEIINKQY